MPALKRFCTGLTLFAFLCSSCSSKSGKSFVPAIPGYHEKDRNTFILNDELLEISGIVNLGDLRFAAINDEDGELFFINLKNDSIVKYRFKGRGDYEDLAQVDSAFFVLESNGSIVEINAPFTERRTYKFTGKHMEFESLVYYKKENKLVMITKDQKNKANGITAISFDLKTRQYDEKPFFNISLKKIFTLLTNYNSECKPSAAAINPVNKKLYVIATVGKVLLECSLNGNVEKIYKINPAHFPQPEGITFAANGDMYISNEGADGKATILQFPYRGRK